MRLNSKAMLSWVVGVFVSSAALAAEDYQLIIKDHRFEPAELIIPANKKVKILVDNQDPTAEEFESHDINREKVISGNSKATIFVGPLKPGSYKFFGEFNPATAQGILVVKE